MNTVTKKDYFLIAVVGFLFGLLLLPILANLKLSSFTLGLGNGIVIIISFTILAVIALWIVSLFSKMLPVLLQIAKFAAVGGLNTLIDLGVLNGLIVAGGSSTASGMGYIAFKSISFIAANINSYFWNKYWTFGSTPGVNAKELGQFFAVSIVGFIINVFVASTIVNAIAPLGGLSSGQWANVGALVAVLASLVWNFLGYKFIVFKKA